MATSFYKLLTLLFIFSGTLAMAQSNAWVQRIGGNSWDDVVSMDMGSDQKLLITGMFQNSADFGGIDLTSWAYQDGFVAKFDLSGNVLWANAINGNDQVWGVDVTTDSNNNVYVTGYFYAPTIYFTANDSIKKTEGSSSDVFLVKYSSNGDFQWAKSGAGTYSLAKSVTCDSQNNVIISGSYNGMITFSETDAASTLTGIYLAKYDGQGNLIWLKSGTSNSQCWFNDLISDDDNNIYATGKISQTIKFGAYTVPNIGGDDMVISKFNSSGDLMWMEVEGNDYPASTTVSNYDCGNSIALDQNGNVFVGGSLLDTIDASGQGMTSYQFATIVKYDNNGMQLWLNKYGDNEVNIIKNIALDNNGDPLVIGNYSGEFAIGSYQLPTQSSDSRAFLAKFNSTDGNPLWASEHGTTTTGEILGVGIQINPMTNERYTTGTYRNTFSFEGNTINSIGFGDIYLTADQSILGIDEYHKSENNILVYPNPATSMVSLSLPASELNYADVIIYNLSGKIVLQSTLNSQHGVIDIAALEAGNYIVKIRTQKGAYRQKLVKL